MQMSLPYTKYANRKQLILKKINISSLKYKPLKVNIETLFSDPANYFKSTINGNQLIVGKKTDPNKRTKLPIPIQISTNHARKSIYQIKEMKANLTSNKSNKSIKRLQTKQSSSTNGLIGNNNRTTQLPPNKRYIDDIELNDIFDKYKQIQQTEPNLTSSELVVSENKKSKSFRFASYQFESELSTKEMNRIFEFQERALWTYSKQRKQIGNIEKNLAKSWGRPKNKWWLNKGDGFRLKKEWKDYFHEWKEKKAQKDPYKWVVEWRDRNTHYVNMGTEKVPQWQMISSPHWLKETIRKPNVVVEKVNYCNMQSPLTSFSNEMGVNGTDLLQFEIENARALKGKKIITKDTNPVLTWLDKEEVFKADLDMKEWVRKKGKSSIY